MQTLSRRCRCGGVRWPKRALIELNSCQRTNTQNTPRKVVCFVVLFGYCVPYSAVLVLGVAVLRFVCASVALRTLGSVLPTICRCAMTFAAISCNGLLVCCFASCCGHEEQWDLLLLQLFTRAHRCPAPFPPSAQTANFDSAQKHSRPLLRCLSLFRSLHTTPSRLMRYVFVAVGSVIRVSCLANVVHVACFSVRLPLACCLLCFLLLWLPLCIPRSTSRVSSVCAQDDAITCLLFKVFALFLQSPKKGKKKKGKGKDKDKKEAEDKQQQAQGQQAAVLQAYNNSEWSAILSARTRPLSAPILRVVSRDKKQLKLGWSKVAGARLYRVFRAKSLAADPGTVGCLLCSVASFVVRSRFRL